MRSNALILFIIILIGSISQIASDLYTPSLLTIANHFNTPINHVQFTMAIYLFGVAASLFFYGPISDAIGRKKPLIAGLIIFLIGSAISFFTSSITMLMIGRFIQGIGAGAGAGMWRSIFRDTFSGDELAKYGSYFSLIVTAIIPIAPAIGGYLEKYIGWRANFAFLFIYAVITLFVVIYKFKESSTHHHIERLKLKFIIKSFKELLGSNIFIGYTLSVFATYGAFFSWYTISPVLLIKYAGLSPVTYGWAISISSIAAMFLSALINSMIVKKFGSQTMLKVGWSIMFATGILLLATHYVLGLNPLAIIIVVAITIFGSMFVFPNAFACSVKPFAHIAGYAGATYSALQLSGGAIIGALASHLPDTTQVPFAILLLVTSSLAWMSFRFIAKPNQETQE